MAHVGCGDADDAIDAVMLGEEELVEKVQIAAAHALDPGQLHGGEADADPLAVDGALDAAIAFVAADVAVAGLTDVHFESKLQYAFSGLLKLE